MNKVCVGCIKGSVTVGGRHVHDLILKKKTVQCNHSCEATTFAKEKWPFKRGGLSSGVEINTFMFRFTLSSGLSRGGGLSSGLGSTIVYRCTVILFKLKSS